MGKEEKRDVEEGFFVGFHGMAVDSNRRESSRTRRGESITEDMEARLCASIDIIICARSGCSSS